MKSTVLPNRDRPYNPAGPRCQHVRLKTGLTASEQCLEGVAIGVFVVSTAIVLEQCIAGAMDYATYGELRYLAGSSKYALLSIDALIMEFFPLLVVVGISFLWLRDFFRLNRTCSENSEAEARAWMDPDWE